MKKLVFGQSLFEVVIALAVVALLAVALVSVTTVSIRNSSFSSSNAQASRHAQAALEWIRGERDYNWTTFVSRGLTATYCLNNLSWNTGSCSSTEFVTGSPQFFREVSLVCYTNQGATVSACSASGVDTVQASVRVTWTDSQGSHSVLTPVQLTNWK